MKVAVIGAAGFAGGELLRLLLQHPDVREVSAASRSAAGRPFGEVHPALAGLSDARFVDAPPDALAARSDVVFLALEHGASSGIARTVLDAAPRVVLDLAADFRVRDRALYLEHYGEHPDFELASRFAYGLADVEGARLRDRRAIAVPGCFATAAALALRPIALEQAEPPPHAGAPPALFAITGSSGAGTRPKESTHHPKRASNVEAYCVLGHRHQAEIVERWREWTGRHDAAPRLAVHQGPFVRGIYLTLHARGAFACSGPALLARAYEGRPFVRACAEPPALVHAVGTNLALVHAAVSEDGSEAQVCVALDNLVKGAAGQAVQAMNLSLGLPEDAGLRLAGAYPC